MADNIVDMVLGAVKPDMVAGLGARLGLDPAKTQSIVNAAVPAMLGGLATTAATPTGAQAIASAVANQDPSVMSNIMGATGGDQMLSSLLGDGKIDQIAQAVGSSAGAPASAVKTVMGTLAPAAMGVIGQQDPATWANGSGIMSMFASQKDAIASALPAGLGSIMGMGGAALGSASAAAAGVAGMAKQAIPTSLSAPSLSASGDDSSSGGMPSWTWGVVGLIVLAGAYYWFTQKAATPPAPPPAPAATEPAKPEAAPAATTPAPAAPAAATPAAPAAATPAAPAATPPAAALPAVPALPDVTAITKQATDALGGVSDTLGSITDPASATAALPKLTEATASLTKLDGTVTALPPAARTAISAATGPAIGNVNSAIDKIEAMPGLGDTVKPTLDALKNTLGAFSGS